MTGPGGPAAGRAAETVLDADAADIDILSQVIADAFHDLAPARWLIPDEAARRQIFPAYFRLFVEHALTSGVVHTIADRAAVALWLPVRENGTDQPAAYAERLTAVTHPWAHRFRAFDAALDRHHPAGAAHPHLALLAVRPDRQGQGIGTALLHAHHTWLDYERAAAYLEASDLRTRDLYLAHGYADLGSPIRLPGGPSMYPMWRQPRPPLTGGPGRPRGA
jgi:GNAT superfamily N-acetyltransferase